MVPDAIVAELDGGSGRTVRSNTQLVLDASRSRDPNERGGVTSHLVFEWSCQPETERMCSSVSKFKGI